MADMNIAVGVRGPVMQNIRFATGPRLTDRGVQLIIFPQGEPLRLFFGQFGPHGKFGFRQIKGLLIIHGVTTFSQNCPCSFPPREEMNSGRADVRLFQRMPDEDLQLFLFVLGDQGPVGHHGILQNAGRAEFFQSANPGDRPFQNLTGIADVLV